jgi:hypothetical protein
LSNTFRLLAAACLAAVCAAQQPPTFKIAGHVVSHTGNRPVRNASVSIVMVEHPDRTLTAVTSENGEFQFFGLPAAKYQLRVEYRGSTQLYEQTDAFSTAIAVGAGLDSEHIVFHLAPAAGISGTVMDGDGDPAAYAMVYLFGKSVAHGLYQTELKNQTTTTLSGTFHFGHLAPGTYYVAASGRPWYAQSGQLQGGAQPAAGSRSELDVAFPMTYYAGSTTPEAAAPVTLEDGSKPEIQIVLNAVPALHIAWDGIEKQPDQNIQASLTQLGPGGTLINVMAMMGPDGLQGVAPGNYILSASLFRSNQQTEIGSQPLSVAGDATVHLNEAIQTSVSGKLSVAGDAPENLAVWLVDLANGSNYALAAKDGSFNVTQIHPGRYSLLMGSMAFYVHKVEVKGATYAGGVLEVARGAQVELSITAAKGMTKIDGTVVHGKTPVAGAMVLAIPQDDTRAKYIPRDQSDSDGTFTLYQVPPGRYTLVAIQDGRNLAFAEAGIIAPYLPQGQVIDVPLAKDAKVELEVQARR